MFLAGRKSATNRGKPMILGSALQRTKWLMRPSKVVVDRMRDDYRRRACHRRKPRW